MKSVAAEPIAAPPDHETCGPESSKLCTLSYCGLVLLTLAVYGQLARGAFAPLSGEPFDFIALDDPDYVSNNVEVRPGITFQGLRWAFGTPHVGNWHPLTWLSLMLDCQIFGPNPAGLHLTNVLLHLANVLLLFTLLRRMTGQLAASFCVAALWSVHPLHVESVAWISERKDVLSMFFALLAILAYERYARDPRVGRYLLVLVAFALSLLAKQMWVTLPCVLLLLDYWPLERTSAPTSTRGNSRYSHPGPRRLIYEKVPLFALAIAFSAMIYLVQRNAGAMEDVGAIPFAERLPNVFVSYWMYLAKTFWPTRLAVMYPYPPGGQPWMWAVACGLPVLAISLMAVVGWKRWPWLLVGWFWFLGMLVPVIGLVSIGSHAWADRYSYAPQIGLLMAIVWSGQAFWQWLSRRASDRAVVVGASIAVSVCLAALVVQGHRQVTYWQDTARLFAHTIAVAENNGSLELTLAGYLVEQHRFAEAEQRYQAILRRAPDDLPARLDLAALWVQQGRINEAVELLAETVRKQPDSAAAHARLAGGMHLQNRIAEAVAEYEVAIKLYPDWATPRNDLAWILATHKSAAVRSAPRAVSLAEEACQLTNHQDPAILDTLAAAYAEAGRWDDSIRIADSAVQLAKARGNKQIAAEIASRAELYRRKQPFRSP